GTFLLLQVLFSPGGAKKEPAKEKAIACVMPSAKSSQVLSKHAGRHCNPQPLSPNPPSPALKAPYGVSETAGLRRSTIASVVSASAATLTAVSSATRATFAASRILADAISTTCSPSTS